MFVLIRWCKITQKTASAGFPKRHFYFAEKPLTQF